MAKKRSDIDRAAVFEAILGDLGNEGDQGAPASSVPISQVRYNRRQPRKHISEEGLADLAVSIKEKGVLEPVIVRRMGAGYELVAGERRTRAAAMAGLKEIPAIVVDIDDREALEIAIIENLQREDLNAVEETEAVLGLLEISLTLRSDEAAELLQAIYSEERGRAAGKEFSEGQKAAAHALFRRLGRFTVSSFVSNRLPILRFPESVLAAVRGGSLAFTKAQAIVRVGDEDDRDRLLAVAVKEGLSLSQIRRRITELRRDGARAAARTDLSLRPLEETQRLVASTKRLLSRRKLALLPTARLERVKALLEEIGRELQED